MLGSLFTRLSFLPKVATKANTSHPIFVPAMHSQTDRALCRLCVRCALNEYLRRTSDVRPQRTTQLFVAYGGQDRGKPISKHGLFKWLVECIKFARWQSRMLIWYGADPQTICAATTWANTYTFAKYYQIDAVVLTLAGSCTPAPHHWGGYRIPQKPHFCQ